MIKTNNQIIVPFLLLVTHFGTTHAAISCNTITEIACSLPDFSTLCTALKLTGLDATLEDGLWTVFAPTEDAFNALPPDVLAGLLDDVDALTDVLLFHAVPGQAITSRDLLCGIVPDDNLITMANGKDSRTVCKEGVPTYQKGAGNGEDNLPAIIGPDNFACNGVIHIVDNVLLSQTVGGGPPATTPPVECSSIAEIACTTPDFSTLCYAMRIVGLGDALLEGNWTVFAPTNDAFAKIDINSIILDIELATDILLYHTVEGEVLYASDLPCELDSNPLEMTNGVDSFTVCVDGQPAFQVGESNMEGMLPAIVATDVPACNGVIHVIDNVMLFNVTTE